MKRLITTLVAAVALLAVGTPASAAPALYAQDGIPTGGTGPSQRSIYEAAAYEVMHPGIAPWGTNDFNCKPAKGQRPVILIPGTSGSAYDSWAWMAPHLKADGLCLFTFNDNPIFGAEQFQFAGDIRDTAQTLGRVVDRVLEATGAEQVDLVGWSQGGGPLPTYYITQLGGAPKVHTVVGIVPSNNGTKYPIAYELAMFNPFYRLEYDRIAKLYNLQAFAQQLAGSDLNKQLYSGTVAQPGIRYMNIATVFDAVVWPYTQAIVNEPGVDNRVIQDICPGRFVTHVSATYDAVVLGLVREGLSGVPQTPQCWQPVPLS